MAWSVEFQSDDDKEYVGICVATFDYGGSEFVYTGRFDLQDGTQSFDDFVADAKAAKTNHDAKKSEDDQIAAKVQAALNK